MVVAETNIVLLVERQSPSTMGEDVPRSGRYRLVGRVDTARRLFDAVQEHGVDVVMAEISTPERLREVVGIVAPAFGDKLVAVSALPAEAALLPLMSAGARGFVGRPFLPGALELAVSAVADGHAFVDPRSTMWLVELALHRSRSSAPDGLTLRQAQVVELVRSGLNRREIARVLGVSPATVKTHLHDAKRRLGAGEPTPGTGVAERAREGRP